MGKSGDNRKTSSSSSQSSSAPVTVESLLARAEELNDDMQPAEAIALLKQAVQLQPDHPAALAALGETSLEVGDQETAFSALSRSIELAPQQHATKFMYYGQLQQGRDALRSFEHGIALMDTRCNEIGDASSDEAKHKQLGMLHKQISTGCCSVAEIWCTDLCDEPEAESSCETSLTRACSVCPENPEAWQAMANLRLLQSRQEDAKQCLGRCLDLMQDSEILTTLSYEFNANTARMCIELELFAAATALIDALLRVDDCFVEMWYLAGFAHFRQQHFDRCAQYLDRAKQMLTKEPHPEIEEAIAEMDSELDKIPPQQPQDDCDES